MEPAKLLRADYLDIIFDQRNKKYGGYELRKHYDRRVGKSIAFLFLALGALICFSFVTSKRPDGLHSRVVVLSPTNLDVTPPKTIPKLLQPPPKPATPPRHIQTSVFTDPVIAPNDVVKPEQEMAENKNIVGQPGLTTATGDSTGLSDASAPGTGHDVIAPSVNTNKPFLWVEQMPQFPGDRDAYMNSHLGYPEAARAAGIEGRVIIGFVVNEDGAVTDAKVMRGIGGGCDEAALKMVSGMPKWKPGKQNGNAVKVFFTLPVCFMLN